MTTVTWSRSVSAAHKQRLKNNAGAALRSALEELAGDLREAGAINDEDSAEIENFEAQIEDLAAAVEDVESQLDDLVEELVGE